MRLGSNKNKYSKKEKRKFNWKLLGSAVGGAIIVTIAYQCIVLRYVTATVKENTIKQVKADYIQVYRLKAGVNKNDPLDENSVEPVSENSKLVPDTYLKDKSKLKSTVARINLGARTLITEDMFVSSDDKISDDTKNQDFDWIKIHSFAKVRDYVDIHYKKADGTDFIVASKKKIDNLNGNVFATNISEEERAYINNATVEAALTKGTLYTSIYPDPQNQPAAVVTYKINDSIKRMIDQNPNIVKESAEKIKSTDNKSTNADGTKPNFIEGGAK